MDVPLIAQDIPEPMPGPSREPEPAQAKANDQILALLMSIQQRLDVVEHTRIRLRVQRMVPYNNKSVSPLRARLRGERMQTSMGLALPQSPYAAT